MGTAREMLKNKTNKKPRKQNPPSSFARLGQVSARSGASAHSFPTVFPLPLFLIESFGHELGTGAVNKQVTGERGGGEAWVRGPDSRPTPGQGERIHQREGHCLQGSLEPRCPRKIFTCICHAGAGPGPLGTLGPYLGVRRSVHFVGFYLQERAWGSQVQGDGCQVKSRGTEEATPALGSEDGSAPRTPGTPIRRPAAPQAPQTSTAGPQSPGLAATCRLRAF